MIPFNLNFLCEVLTIARILCFGFLELTHLYDSFHILLSLQLTLHKKGNTNITDFKDQMIFYRAISHVIFELK